MTSQGILFVGTFLSSAGIHRTYCEDMADRIEARNWRVVRTSDRRARLRRVVDMIRTTWSRRRDYEVAHVDVFSGPAFAWAETVCFELHRLGKPYVLTLRGGNLPRFSRRWTRRTRRLLGSAAIVTSPSGYLRESMAHYAREIVVLPNALEVAGYPFELRRRPRPRLVWLRAFHAVYNPVLAVEVLARLRHSGATMTMVGADRGDGSLEATRHCANRLGVDDRLRIIPGVPKADVAATLATADIFLNTTDVDNTPISVLEAMACGLCVVSTDVGGIPYLLRHEIDSLVVPPRDPAAMAHAVERLLTDPDLSARLSAAARERTLAFDWSHVLDRWEALFTQVIARV